MERYVTSPKITKKGNVEDSWVCSQHAKFLMTGIISFALPTFFSNQYNEAKKPITGVSRMIEQRTDEAGKGPLEVI